jgi:hypothetical protein
MKAGEVVVERKVWLLEGKVRSTDSAYLHACITDLPFNSVVSNICELCD